MLAPSPIIGAYLAVTLAFDAVILRTFWLSVQDDRLRGVLTASLVLKFVITILEAQGKGRHVTRPEDRNRSPEEFSGPYARSLVWWLNGLIYRGFKHVIQPADLFPEKSSLRAELLNKRFWNTWRKGESVSPVRSSDTILTLCGRSANGKQARTHIYDCARIWIQVATSGSASSGSARLHDVPAIPFAETVAVSSRFARTEQSSRGLWAHWGLFRGLRWHSCKHRFHIRVLSVLRLLTPVRSHPASTGNAR